MIYYKITNKNSKAWNLHELFAMQQKEVRRKLNDVIDMYNLPKKAYTRGETVAGFEAPDDESDIPDGMHINKSGLMVPNRKTRIGREIEKELKAIKFPSNEQYMKNMFGVSASAVTSANRMTTGCAVKVIGDTVLVNVQNKVLHAAKTKEKFNIPAGLEEITGTEYHDIINSQAA